MGVTCEEVTGHCGFSHGHCVSDPRVQAVGLLIQYSDSEDETCTENDDHAMRLSSKLHTLGSVPSMNLLLLRLAG